VIHIEKNTATRPNEQTHSETFVSGPIWLFILSYTEFRNQTSY